MALILPVVEIEFGGRGGGWTDVTADVVRASDINISPRGLAGDGITDRVAQPAVANLAFLNSAQNSIGLAGYYSPRHANARSGFVKGAGLRISAAVDADAWVDTKWVVGGWVAGPMATIEPIFTGTILDIDPEPGQYVGKVTHVEAVDEMDIFARQRLTDCDVERGVNESEAIQIISDATSIAARDEEIGTGPDSFPFVFDRLEGESEFATTELQRICQSSHGTFYVKGNGKRVYEPRNEKRAVFGAALTPDVDLTDADLRVQKPPEIEDTRDDLVTKVTTVITPREVQAVVVIFQLQDSLSFLPGTVSTFSGLFTDPDDRALRIGAVDLVTQATPTDYEFYTEPDGTGTDHSGDVVVTVSACGNNATFTVDTTDVAIATTVYTGGDITFQLRGSAINAKEPIYFEAEVSPTPTTGENAVTVEMPYQLDDVAEALGEWYLDKRSEDEPRVISVPLRLDKDDSSGSIAILQSEVSDIFSLTETLTGLDGTTRHFIQSIGWEIEGAGPIWPTWYGAPADSGPFIEFGSDHLTTGGSTATGDTITSRSTASVLPNADQINVLTVAAKRGSSTNPGTPSVSGNGLTWTLVNDVIYDGSGTTRRREWLFASIGSAPTQGKVTINNFGGTSQGQQRVSWSLSSLPTTGTTVANSIVQSVTNSGSDVASLTVTLAAFADAANRPFCGWALNADVQMAAELGWTTLGYRADRTAMLSAWKDDGTDTGCIATIPGSSGAVGGIAAEIKGD